MGFKTPGSTPGRISEKMEVNLICKLYSRLENSVEKGARQATGHGVAEVDMTERLTHTHTHTHTHGVFLGLLILSHSGDTHIHAESVQDPLKYQTVK